MAGQRIEALGEILRPRIAKAWFYGGTALGSYQFLCDQFDAPKIPRLVGMTGLYVPWWGWLLIAQAGLVYALFEYVRRTVVPVPDRVESVDLARLRTRIAAAEEKQAAIINDYQNMLGVRAQFSDEMDKLKEQIRSQFETVRANYAQHGSRLDEGKQALKLQNQKFAAALNAINLRERFVQLAVTIRADAAELSHKVSERQPHDAISWGSWQSVYSHWWGSMSEWWSIARFYLPNSREVLLVSDHMYAQTIIDEATLVPAGGAEAVRVYKKFRIIQDQWEAVQDKLSDNVRLVAFHGLSEQEVRHGQPVEQG